MSRLAAVLGHPVSHSKSPAMHRAAYALLGEDIDYSAIDVTEAGLPALMQQVAAEPAWCGLSVTMPLKTAVIAEVHEVRGVAGVLGVVNTVAFEGTGSNARRIAYNTDVEGIVSAVRYAGVGEPAQAVVIGGGATSAAAVAALSAVGARAVQVFVRDTGRATDARAAAGALGISLDVRPLSGAAQAVAGADVVISTLPPRAADGLAGELEQLQPATPGVLLDVAYDPWPSRIAGTWSAGGGTVVPGLEMLLYQAVEQVRLFTGRGEDVNAAVIDVMCDAVGLPRRAY
ncbi:shikimate dehydrogenase [Pseudarthrobacter sp. J64]|uniref:shikimate dehydrogenase n=1 Tax=Pseudarthrobacter sp. J64 TaxID=3116485 RepID=UPI002E8142E6|nr:shikimate dehydrogenase [Pseudarthrobacter sp. J64]MEE2569224.1 shikimate dehydrogenase [Pseudarthrobacter sp. J64]